MKGPALPRFGRHANLTKHVNERAIRAAIDAAEARTSGTVHVTLARNIRQTTLDAAARAFHHLGFANEDAAAVLFFVVPERREFAIIGSRRVHDAVGDAYWSDLAAEVSRRIRSDGLTPALVYGIDAAGRELARLFPS